MSFFKRLLGAAIMVAAVPSAFAAYPDTAIRLIVPFGAGGITDIIARQLGQELGNQLNQTVVIENRAGAGGTIGAQAAAAAAPDGYTVFMGTVGTQIVNPLIMSKVNYDPKNFIPVGMISGSPYVLAARADLGLKDFKGLVEYAKAHPGDLNFGSAGIGSSPHLGLELLKLTSDVDIAHIPFKSGGEAVNAAVGGHGDLAMDAIPVVMPHVKSGKLVALALAAENRSSAAPDVPTSVEVGNEGLRISSWNALFVPAGTPAAAVDTLNAALQKALASPALKDRLEAQGSEVYTGTLDEYQAFITAETQKWESIVKTANIQLN
jgi:tripartite-type tricarboxylate transporter receptor subunit TctC